MKKYQAHEYANLFPMMTAVELDALAEDIAANGLRHPVVLFDGKILDGRNRSLACEKAGVEPAFAEHEGDEASALSLVISLNVQRRDMTAGQKAIVAARAMQHMPERRGRPKDGKSSHVSTLSRDMVAGKFKVSDKSVQQAKALLAEAPDLAQQVEACTTSLAAAYEQLQQRRADAVRKAKDAQRVAEYTEAISNGEMRLEDALQKAIEAEREEREKTAALADTRRNWLKQLATTLEWIETFVSDAPDETLAWYTEPGSPGFFDHGITARRVAEAVRHLDRARRIAFGGKANGQKESEVGGDTHKRTRRGA